MIDRQIESILAASRAVVAAHDAHVVSGRSDDTWDALCDAHQDLLAHAEVVAINHASDLDELAKLVVAAFEAGHATAGVQ